MKKLNLLFTALLLLCCIGTAKAEEVTIDGIKYDVAKQATVIKGGNYSGDIVIPSEITYNDVIYRVTSIGKWAFSGCTGLTSIEIPNSVTSIEENAFSRCTGLTSIEIPNSVTSIGNSAFSNCSGLESVVIGNSVTSIGFRAFSGCTGLTSIEIPNSVTSIEENAFSGCTGLTSIEIPNSVTSIGKWAFYGCTGLTSATIGNSVTSIESYAFSRCSGLTSITSLIPAENLFAISSVLFANVNKTACTLYVPYGAKETYAATAGWEDFVNIVEMDFTGIDEVFNEVKGEPTVDASQIGTNGRRPEGLKAKVKTIYDFQGRKVEVPSEGIYIIDGKKVMIK